MLECPLRLTVFHYVCVAHRACICSTVDGHSSVSAPGVNSNSADMHVQLSLSGSHLLLSFVCPEVRLLDHVDIRAKKVSEKLNNGHQTSVVR